MHNLHAAPPATPESTDAAAPANSRDPVHKALQVLRWVIDSPDEECGVRQIARSLGWPPSTVHRALTHLESNGLVTSVGDNGEYSLGLEMFRLASKVNARFSLRNAALPALRELEDRLGETSFLGIYDDRRQEMTMAAAVETSNPVRYVVTLNEWHPLYLAASGLAILAFLPDETREAILSDLADDDSEDRQKPEVGKVRDVIDTIRAAGYARTVGERVPGGVGIAAPIFDPQGRVVGDVGVTLPLSRFEDSREHELASHVLACAERVMRTLVF